MKRITIFLLILLAITCLSFGCSTPKVQPDIKKWDMTNVPIDESWVGPPKTWFSNYQPGESRTQTILVHAPRTYTVIKLVSTIDNDNGILEQKLDIPLSLDGKSPFTIVSEYSGESPKLKNYNPNTQVATITGFAPVKMDRLVQFTYVPDYLEYSLYFSTPMGTDSGKELIEDVTFTPIGENARQWVTFPESNLSYITIRVKPQQTREVPVTLKVPESCDIPESWEYRIGIANTTGIEYSKGLTVASETNCKFLVSKNALRLIE